jgi:S-DNA-T family DNA segregation ATPase FtsK/SpoIIIE
VSDVELNRLVNFWKAQVAPGSRSGYDQELPEGIAGAETPMVQPPLWPDMAPIDQAEEDSNEDPLLEDAIAVVTKEGRASVSLLQRRLRIGYTRAARLIDTLEEKKIVGPATGSTKMREVFGAPQEGQPPDPPRP